MASKKYRGKTCVYCTEVTSDTADHVVSRSFVPRLRRHGIPKVPACQPCNSEKSALETYLSAFLPLGSTAESALEISQHDLERRIAKNKRLARELRFMADLKWTEKNSGVFVPELELPLKPEFVVALLTMIGRGLIWHHFSTLIGPNFNIQSSALTEQGERIMKKSFFPNLSGCVSSDVGNGSVQYVGKQSAEYPELTIWLMRFYAGIGITDLHGQNVSRCFLVLSGKEELFRSRMLQVLFGAT